ncbi:MAG: hypothetical protein RLZ98_1428 [Pseudomonadota bacterium]
MLEFTDRGIYCPAGDFFIDPWRPVDRALITHGHADHARPGHASYLCTSEAAPVLRHRLGNILLDTIGYSEILTIGGVKVSFHPAGHIPGSAQIRIEKSGEIWVVSGDYKLQDDRISQPFEPVRCHTFISECTFGLPVFKWRPQTDVIADMETWWRENQAAGRLSVIGAYALGKAQRIIANVSANIGPLYMHAAIDNVNRQLPALQPKLSAARLLTPEISPGDLAGALIVVPPAAMDAANLKRFGDVSTAFASGWMALRGIRRRRSIDRGFVLSDHADWPALGEAIRATGAERVYVTHGYTQVYCRWLVEQGYDARVVTTGYEGDEDGADNVEATIP